MKYIRNCIYDTISTFLTSTHFSDYDWLAFFGLDHHLCFSEIFPEFFWSAIFLFSENPIKVREIVETALVTNFGDRICCVYKVSGCMT